MHLPSKEIERSCIYVLRVSNLPLSTILIFYLGIVSQCSNFCFLFYFSYMYQMNFRENKLKGNSTMDNSETLATLDTQDTGRRQTDNE